MTNFKNVKLHDKVIVEKGSRTAIGTVTQIGATSLSIQTGQSVATFNVNDIQQLAILLDPIAS